MTSEEFDIVYKQHRRLVAAAVHAAYSQCRDAEDLRQRAWLQIWRKLGTVAHPDHLSTWIYRVAFNEARMAWRADYLAARRSLDSVVSLEDGPVDPRSGESSPMQVPVRDHDLDNVVAKLTADRLLELLPPSQRRIIRTTFLDERLGREAAEELHCTVGNIKSQTYKGIKTLRAVAGNH